jgi:hypothetical protein
MKYFNPITRKPQNLLTLLQENLRTYKPYYKKPSKSINPITRKSLSLNIIKDNVKNPISHKRKPISRKLLKFIVPTTTKNPRTLNFEIKYSVPT